MSVHRIIVSTRSAAGGGGGDGSVDVKMLAEQNVKLKDALKRLHSHSIAEKTEASTPRHDTYFEVQISTCMRFAQQHRLALSS